MSEHDLGWLPDVSKEQGTPEVIGLCPVEAHTGDFYVPRGGNCPADHIEEPQPLVEYVKASRLSEAEAELARAREAVYEAHCTGWRLDVLLEAAEARAERAEEALREIAENTMVTGQLARSTAWRALSRGGDE